MICQSSRLCFDYFIQFIFDDTNVGIVFLCIALLKREYIPCSIKYLTAEAPRVAKFMFSLFFPWLWGWNYSLEVHVKLNYIHINLQTLNERLKKQLLNYLKKSKCVPFGMPTKKSGISRLWM
jgi:hypothetical protein